MSDANDRKDAGAQKKGGFGAFSQQYRDRWAAGHPNARKADPADTATPQPAPDAPPADAADATGDDRDTGTTP